MRPRRSLAVSLGLLLPVILAGCYQKTDVIGPPLDEVVTVNAPAPRVKSVVVADMVAAQFQITKDSEFLLAFDRPTKNVGAAILLSSRLYGTVNERVTLTFVPSGQATRVQMNQAFVTNPGSAFEMITPYSVNSDPGRAMGQWLAALPSKVAGQVTAKSK